MKALKAYELQHDRLDHKTGQVVYEFPSYDYGLSSDDTRSTGVEHISVTLNSDGDYPYFTVPVTSLKCIEVVDATGSQHD